MSAARTLALEALNSILKMEDTESNEWDAVERVIPEMCSVARAAIAAIEAETDEPVAWRKNHKGVVDVRHTYTDNPGDVVKWAELGVTLEPLYAAQPPAVPQGWQLVTICMLKQVTEALAARLGTNDDEWPLVLSARNIIEDLA